MTKAYDGAYVILIISNNSLEQESASQVRDVM
jgi:hypothetical protein